jgi:hypothetical protein
LLRVRPARRDPSELAARIRTAPGRPDDFGRGWADGARPTSTRSASEATAKGYEAAIEETLRLVRDPAHKALGIWGKALADMGVDEADLLSGLGAAYARGLSTFRGTS